MDMLTKKTVMTATEFQETIQTYDQQLRPFAYNLVKNKEECEDLIQDTLYRAMVNREKFAEGTNLRAWLFTIMRNIFINNYRRKKLQKTVADGSDNQYLINNNKSTVSNESDRSFLSEEISKAMAQVSQDFVAPFMMYFSGYKYQEIADYFHLPLGTVKSRIFFARRELQAHLGSLGVTPSAN
jgi:RNA polymerase sigma-70 factor, ECF subfamily